MMTVDEVLTLLRAKCAEVGSQIAWADKHNLSGAYVSDVLRGGRKPGKAILDALGLVLVEKYTKKP